MNEGKINLPPQREEEIKIVGESTGKLKNPEMVQQLLADMPMETIDAKHLDHFCEQLDKEILDQQFEDRSRDEIIGSIVKKYTFIPESTDVEQEIVEDIYKQIPDSLLADYPGLEGQDAYQKVLDFYQKQIESGKTPEEAQAYVVEQALLVADSQKQQPGNQESDLTPGEQAVKDQAKQIAQRHAEGPSNENVDQAATLTQDGAQVDPPQGEWQGPWQQTVIDGQPHSTYATHLSYRDALHAPYEDMYKKAIKGWAGGKPDSLQIDQIKATLPLDAAQYFSSIDTTHTDAETKARHGKVMGQLPDELRGLMLRDADTQALHVGKTKGEKWADVSADQITALGKSIKLGNEALVDAQKRMPKVKSSTNAEHAAEYWHLRKQVIPQLERSHSYETGLRSAIEGFDTRTKAIEKIDRTLEAGNYSMGEAAALAFKGPYHYGAREIHRYGRWKHNALVNNEKDNTGFNRWKNRKLIQATSIPGYLAMGVAAAPFVVIGGIWGLYKFFKASYERGKKISWLA